MVVDEFERKVTVKRKLSSATAFSASDAKRKRRKSTKCEHDNRGWKWYQHVLNLFSKTDMN